MDDLKKITIDPTKLRKARGDRGLTEVARQIGISKQRLYNYENGLKDPSTAILARLVLLYRVPLEQLTNASEKFLKKAYTGG